MGGRVEARSVRGLAHMVLAAHGTPARRLEKLFYDLLSLICHYSVICPPHEMVIGSGAWQNTSLLSIFWLRFKFFGSITHSLSNIEPKQANKIMNGITKWSLPSSKRERGSKVGWHWWRRGAHLVLEMLHSGIFIRSRVGDSSLPRLHSFVQRGVLGTRWEGLPSPRGVLGGGQGAQCPYDCIW